MKQRSLGRVAGDLFDYVQFFRDAPNEVRPSAADLRSHLLRMIDDFGRDPVAKDLPPDELQAARFGLVAWIDETIVRSSWPGRDDWILNLLQTQLFGTNRAGNEFYDHLEALRPEMVRAREIFFLCLALGFEGQMVGNEAGRTELMRRHYEMLRQSGAAIDSAATPHLTELAYNTAIEVHGGAGRRLWPVLATWLVATLGAFGLLFLALWMWAGGVPTPPGH